MRLAVRSEALSPRPAPNRGWPRHEQADSAGVARIRGFARVGNTANQTNLQFSDGYLAPFADTNVHLDPKKPRNSAKSVSVRRKCPKVRHKCPILFGHFIWRPFVFIHIPASNVKKENFFCAKCLVCDFLSLGELTSRPGGRRSDSCQLGMRRALSSESTVSQPLYTTWLGFVKKNREARGNSGGAYIASQCMCPLVGDADINGDVCATREPAAERAHPGKGRHSAHATLRTRILPTLFVSHRKSHHSLSLPTNSLALDGLNVPRKPPNPVEKEIQNWSPRGSQAQDRSMMLGLIGRLRTPNMACPWNSASLPRSWNLFGIRRMVSSGGLQSSDTTW